MMSEAGGPDSVSVIGPRDKADDGNPRRHPYLIYMLYVTKEYIAIIALPADGE